MSNMSIFYKNVNLVKDRLNVCLIHKYHCLTRYKRFDSRNAKILQFELVQAVHLQGLFPTCLHFQVVALYQIS